MCILHFAYNSIRRYVHCYTVIVPAATPAGKADVRKPARLCVFIASTTMYSRILHLTNAKSKSPRLGTELLMHASTFAPVPHLIAFAAHYVEQQTRQQQQQRIGRCTAVECHTFRLYHLEAAAGKRIAYRTHSSCTSCSSHSVATVRSLACSCRCTHLAYERSPMPLLCYITFCMR